MNRQDLSRDQTRETVTASHCLHGSCCDWHCHLSSNGQHCILRRCSDWLLNSYRTCAQQIWSPLSWQPSSFCCMPR